VKEQCIDVILDRRSCNRFAPDPVSQDDLERILTAALRAPAPGGAVTGGYRGSQPFSIIVVRHRARRARLNKMLCEGRRKCIEEAPVSLVFCVDTHRLNRWAELEGGVPHFRGIGVLWIALRATYTAAENSVIAASALGLGTQYIQEIAWQPYETLQFFDLPRGVLPVALLVVGHPAELPPLAPSLPLEAVVHEETYRDPSDDELLRYFEEPEQYYNEWLDSLPADSRVRKVIDERGVQNLAQWVSLLAYSDSFYRWRDDVIRSNLALSELE
jgi:FMN reductase (NADPH)